MASGNSSRIPSHQLSNGLYVSGHPDQHKEKATLMSSAAMPYTGGDIKKSGELGKMFDIPVLDNPKRKSGPMSGPLPPSRTAFSTSGPLSSAAGGVGGGVGGGIGGIPRQNSLGSKASSGLHVQGQGGGVPSSKSGPISGGPPPVSGRPKSGPVPKGLDSSASLSSGGQQQHPHPLKTSGPQAPERSKSSGPLNLPATGLITSGPLPHKTSGPQVTGGHGGGPKRTLSGPHPDLTGSSSKHLGASVGSHAVNKLHAHGEHTFKKNCPRFILVTVVILFVLGFAVGGYFAAIVHSPILLIVVGGLFLLVVLLWTWNSCWGEAAVTRYVLNHPDAELSKAEDGRYVKVTGVSHF